MAAIGFVILAVIAESPLAADSRARMPVTSNSRAAATVNTPVISGLNPNSCYQKGERFNIIGSGFGAARIGRTPALRGIKGIIRLIVDGWSDTGIQVRMPDDSGILPGKWYSVGIASSAGHWLLTPRHKLRVCEAVVTSSPNRSIQTTPGGGNTTYTLQGDKGKSIHNNASSTHGNGFLPAPEVKPMADKNEDNIRSEPHELLVLSTDLPQAEQLRQQAQEFKLSIKRRRVLKGFGLIVSVFRVPEGISPQWAINKLRAKAPELIMDFNHRLTMQGDEARSYPSKMIHWPESARNNCCKGLRIGMVDGPLPKNHPMLKDAEIEHHSFIAHGIAPGPTEHALAVASILVGGQGMGLTVSSKLYVAEVMRLRDNSHVDTTVDYLLQGLDWLVQQQVHLINLSLGGPSNIILKAAVQRVLDMNIPVIAAVGNNGASAGPVYPAAIPGVIAVTAIDAERRLYQNANQGRYVMFAAPGVDIWVPRKRRDFSYVSGTSYAAPYVTALLSLEWQQQPQSTWKQRLQKMVDYAVDLGEPGRDTQFGYGLPNYRP